ncbi:MAG: hypothetical protein BWX48_01363 [Verrucomicrobia bacterium ADurb.Bin006]|jgi:hypothetical protein|nr:MAG: hypothetical protein BWX48_01363 [Verrucomicrobia bacterium ADurb.Bin006]
MNDTLVQAIPGFTLDARQLHHAGEAPANPMNNEQNEPRITRRTSVWCPGFSRSGHPKGWTPNKL